MKNYQAICWQGLAVNKKKPCIKKLPDSNFTRLGKLANRLPSELAHSLEIIRAEQNAYSIMSAPELKAVITINEINYKLIYAYLNKYDPQLFLKIHDYLIISQGQKNYQSFLTSFNDLFLKDDSLPRQEYYQLVLIEILLNWLNNTNPALNNYYNLFENQALYKDSGNLVIIQELVSQLQGKKIDQDLHHSKGLYQILREPALKYPNSIRAQLEFILETWGEYLSDMSEILHSLDSLKEQNHGFGGSFPPPKALQYSGSNIWEDEEYYSEDTHWMPSLVLLAKSTYVWLHQLSHKYGRSITRLNQVPDQELRLLQQRGITGLWLIGIWQRSHASQIIKSRNGDHQAIASAYSLDSYRIADELGGDAAWENLSQRALNFGIRMGCDMVPNHTGIDSQWILHHPDWFLQRKELPFPNYSFKGENLSPYPEIEIRIEDHYFAKSDAAVVFELYDKRDGSRRYIYHGNDGTGLPWNDTAQLDYMKKEVRQAVLQEIIKIAQKIPVIRFDAAMTLAKKHYQRLWFPLLGSGGDIPTRSEYSLTKTQFDSFFPREFWREVVDQVASQAPDTLLLAEAFWMMEGFFVRNLGMHRVYNSAFMHMMMREDNAAFRRTLINTLEFDKRILKRFVNFMSNPDEATAIEQFGDDDKYFGVCVLMCTLPGLPMFGHGQIEGLKEKYGMEFASPRMDESENKYLIKRHEKEIFPLLKKRKVFAEADNFCLYDFFEHNNNLNENVIAFSNYNLGVHSLVIYNNSYSAASGKINQTTDYSNSKKNNGQPEKIDLAKILKLEFGPERFLIYKDLVSGYEYLRYCDEILTSGFSIDLNAYEYHVFANFKMVNDPNLKLIYDQLGHAGMDSISAMLKRIELKPLHDKLRNLFSYSMITNQEMIVNGELTSPAEKKFFLEAELFPLILEFHHTLIKKENLTPWADDRFTKNIMSFFKYAEQVIIRHQPAFPMPPSVILAVWFLLKNIKIIAEENKRDFEKLILDNYLKEPLSEIMTNCCDCLSGRQCLDIVFVCLKFDNLWIELLNHPHATFLSLLNDSSLQDILGVHQYNQRYWFQKEAFEIVMAALEVINRLSRAAYSRKRVLNDINTISLIFKKILLAGKKSKYDFELLKHLLNPNQED